MSRWNFNEKANVCEKCGFQALSLPTFNRHKKHCSGLTTADQSTFSNTPSLTGMKESIPASKLGETTDHSNISKPPREAAVKKSLLYCKLCPFSCAFSSQLINHKKKVHTAQAKLQKDLPKPRALELKKTMKKAVANGTMSGEKNEKNEAEESSCKKEFILKKMKVEMEGAAFNFFPQSTREQKETSSQPAVVCEVPTVVAESNESNKSRKCPLCGYVAKTKESMVSHRASHEAESVVYSCNECEYKTPARKNFERHEWCHVVDSPFKCQHCSFSSNGENAIKRHTTAYHSAAGVQGRKGNGSNLGEVSETSGRLPKPSSNHAKKNCSTDNSKEKSSAEKQILSPPGSVTSTVIVSSMTTTTTASAAKQKQPAVKSEASADQEHFACNVCSVRYKTKFQLDQHAIDAHCKTTSSNVQKPFSLSNQTHPNVGEADVIKKKPESLLVVKLKGLPPHAKVKDLPQAKVKIEAKPDSTLPSHEAPDPKKVFRCGHCSFSTGDFSQLKDHLEKESCKPLKQHSPTSLLRAPVPGSKETVLQKLLTNDNPSKVYPKPPALQLSPPVTGFSLPATSPKSISTRAGVSVCEKNVLIKTEKIYDAKSASSTSTNVSSGPPLVVPSNNKSALLSPNQNSTTGMTGVGSGDKSKLKKMYINCLFCTYKTLSKKVIKKHLIKEHSIIITSKKILSEVLHKSILLSTKCSEGDGSSTLNSAVGAMKTELSGHLQAAGSFQKRHQNDVSLQMDVQCEAENSPPATTAAGDNSKLSRSQGTLTERPKMRLFKCSKCGRKSKWKHVIKKHIENEHDKANIVVLFTDEAEIPNHKTQKHSKQEDASKYSSSVYNHTKPANGYVGYAPPRDILQTTGSSGSSRDATATSATGTGLESGSDEILGMTDNLRLRRFKCSVCIYRSNFRCDMSRHLKKRHPDVPGRHFTVMTVQDASESLPSYNYSWPEAEALLLGMTKEELEAKQSLEGVLAQVDASADRKTAVLVKVPLNGDELKRCSVCPFATHKTELLRLHMAYHQPQKRNGYSCTHCPFFVNTARLLRHHLALHENDQLIKSAAAERDACRLISAYNAEFNSVKRNPKYICEDCPYTSNNRGEFWHHRKCHVQRRDVPSDMKCQICPYWAEDKKDWNQHLSLHGDLDDNFTKPGADLAIREFCRCDLADFKNFPDLACFKQLRCPYCTLRSSSVVYMRHHIVTHAAAADASRHRVFGHDLDAADDTLGNLCTRLLNMNYDLVECRSDLLPPSCTCIEDDDQVMPVLERVSDVPLSSALEGDEAPGLSIPLKLEVTVSVTPAENSLDKADELVRSPAAESSERDENYDDGNTDDVGFDGEVMEAETVVVAAESAEESVEAIAVVTETDDCVMEMSSLNGSVCINESEEEKEVGSSNVECPYGKTLFFLSLNLVPFSSNV